MSKNTTVLMFVLGDSLFYMTKKSWINFTDSLNEAAMLSEDQARNALKAYQTDAGFRAYILNSGLRLRKNNSKYKAYPITLNEFTNFSIRQTQIVLI